MDETSTILENENTEAENKDEAVKGVKRVTIVDEMQKSYIDYAMSVIVGRALPDARDGLKPVQRRIIYAMFREGIVYGTKFQKSAAVVGEVLKKYHPHGDSSVYEAMVRMAQTFSLRYPLVQGQGNFGSIDGDSPAAQRYTEARLAKISNELVKNIDEETVPLMDNYSGDVKEPTLLPSAIPNLLLNGSTGIAVGMATNIPPHNLTEVINACIAAIDKYDPDVESKIFLPSPKAPFESNEDTDKRLETSVERPIPVFESSINVEELVEHIQGPDFPTRGIIYNKQDVLQAYGTGKGKITMRGVAEIEEVKGGKFKIIITELPYQVIKSKLVSKIADLVRNKKIEGISDIRDESNREGMRVVIEVKSTGRPQKILNAIYKQTDLQQNFNCNFVALVDNEPKLMTLKMIIEEFIRHRQRVVIRRSEYNLAKLQEREHILQGLKIALDHIDEVIATIKKSKDTPDARENLVKKFSLTVIQADAILEMQLRRLAQLEREKIENELKDILNNIANLKELISSPEKILAVIKSELSEIKELYGDERITKAVKGKIGEFSEEDLIVNEENIITITKAGYIKRLKASTYKSQGRGGKGMKGMSTKEGDAITDTAFANTHDDILFFTNTGRVFKKRVWDIPESSRTAKGTNVVNLLDLQDGEKISKFVTAEDIKKLKYVVFVTMLGVAKRCKAEEFENIRQNGIIAIKLKGEDKLVSVDFTKGSDTIVIATSKGKAIRFKEKDLRAMGRTATGVRGIRLSKEDFVINAESVDAEKESLYILTVSKKGYGKRTNVSNYAVQNRGGKGVISAKVSAKTGELVDSLIVGTKGDLLLSSAHGQVIRIDLSKVSVLSRNTQGVRLMNVSANDELSAITLIEENEEDEEE